MSAECSHSHAAFDGMATEYQRRLWIVIAINAAMFVTEMAAGHAAGSKALQADALDFFADAITYAISLWAIGRHMTTRANVALAKGASLFLMGLYVLVTTLWQFITHGLPAAEIMGMIGFLAFAANLVSVLLLKRYKDGDANIRSVWLCSRNDMIGNIAVICASAAVWITASGWPDLIVALYMGSLFLWSSVQILQQAWRERNGGGGSEHESHGAHDGHSH